MIAEDWIDFLFGHGSDLDALQMSLRAVAVFALALLMIRLAGRSSFGLHRPFDACISVLLGAVLSRAVVGASPFWPTMCAGVVLVLVHRGVALASLAWPRVEAIVNGHERELVRDGRLDATAMRRALLTRHDLEEATRRETGDERTPLRRAVMERDGSVTVMPAKPEK